MFKLNKMVPQAPSVIPCFTLSVIKPHCFNDCHHCTGFDNENDDHEDEWLGFPTDCDFVSQRFGSGSFELEKCYFAIDENRNVDFLQGLFLFQPNRTISIKHSGGRLECFK